jgi:hypothetical protein
VEQRHRQVADVGSVKAVPLDQRAPGEQDHRVGHLDSLRLTAGARGEDHHERVVGTDLAMRYQCGRGGDAPSPFVGAHVEDGDAGQVEVVEQVPLVGSGEHELAVDAGDVAGQGFAAASGVEAAQDVSPKARRGQGSQHVRGVAHEDTDVQRPRGIRGGDDGGGLCLRRRNVLSPRPRQVSVLDGDRVEVSAGSKQLLECVRHRWLPCVNRN